MEKGIKTVTEDGKALPYKELLNNPEYLEEIYPILKGSCEFVQDYLTENEKGQLITAPSNSPENEFYYIDANGEKQESMFTEGATIDFQIIYALFTRTIHACKVLKRDEEFSKTLSNNVGIFFMLLTLL